MSDKLIECSKICVDCVNNDPVDIRCSGPHYLGFDFFVRAEQTTEMQKFIVMTLNSLKVPLINIYVSGKELLSEKNIWTKERIVQAIKDDAESLQSEAERNYGSYFKI